MLTVKNYKLVFLVAVIYLVLYHLYYAGIFDYLVEKKISIGIQGEYLKGYMKRGQLFLWMMNILTVGMIFIRILFVTLCLLLGTILSKNVKLSFRNLLKIVLLSEFVFLVRDISVISVILISKNPDRPVIDVSLSAGSFFSKFVRDYPMLSMPASSISLYLLVYILVLSFLIYKSRIAWGSSLKFVCSYYGISYIIWLLLSFSFNLYASN